MKPSPVHSPSHLLGGFGDGLRRLAALFLVLAFATACSTASAPVAMPVAALATDKYASIVVDGRSGAVVHSYAPDEPRYPASLTKMMTILMLFEALDSGRVTKETQIPVSADAASRPPTKIGFRRGGSIDVDSAIKALTIRSANDVAAAVGEYFAGTEEAFGQMMTQRARQLGMTRTTFRNASGLTDPLQTTTARDMARLALLLRSRFPHHYHYFGNREFFYGGSLIRGHNRLIGRVPGVDGIKTGYTRASGYNVATSLDVPGGRLVVVCMGAESAASRDDHVAALIARFHPSGPRMAFAAE